MMVTQKEGCRFEVTWQRRMVGARALAFFVTGGSTRDPQLPSASIRDIQSLATNVRSHRTGVDPVWWTPLKLIFEVSDAPLPNRLSAGVPATDGRSGALWTHARRAGA
jgi:hypothetical protein